MTSKELLFSRHSVNSSGHLINYCQFGDKQKLCKLKHFTITRIVRYALSAFVRCPQCGSHSTVAPWTYQSCYMQIARKKYFSVESMSSQETSRL